MTDLRAELRAFALGLPGATEGSPWGILVTKVRGKIFVFLGDEPQRDPPGMSVKLAESHAHALTIEGAVPTAHGLGRAGWVNVPLHADGLPLDLLCDWIEESYRIVAPKALVAELDTADR